jgi:putative transposon-encoded protein
MKSLIYSLSGLLLLTFAFVGGSYLGDVNLTVLSNPTVQIREKPIIITQNVTVEREVIKEKLVYPEYKTFNSLDEVEAMFKGSVTIFRPNECLAVAQMCQEVALEQGYIVNIAFTLNGFYYGWKVSSIEAGHAVLLIQVGEEWYIVDPYLWEVTKLW